MYPWCQCNALTMASSIHINIIMLETAQYALWAWPPTVHPNHSLQAGDCGPSPGTMLRLDGVWVLVSAGMTLLADLPALHACKGVQ